MTTTDAPTTELPRFTGWADAMTVEYDREPLAIEPVFATFAPPYVGAHRSRARFRFAVGSTMHYQAKHRTEPS